MRGLLRAIKEVGRRTVVGRYVRDLGSPGNNVYTKRLPLNTASLATADGELIGRGGGAVHCHPQTFAGCRAEIFFGNDAPTDDTSWLPLDRAQIAVPPNGESFDGFRVRLRADSSFDATKELVLVVDPAPYGSEAMDAKPPTPEVDLFGAAAFLAKIVRRSDGVVASIEGADGSAADRGAPIVAGLDTGNVGRALRVMANGTLNVAGFDGAAQRELAVAAAALAATLAPAAGTLFAASFGYVYDVVGATWRRAVSDAGTADTGTLRVTDALTLTAVPTLPVAGNVSAQLVAANARRRAVILTNRHATDSAYLNFGATAAAVATGVELKAGESRSFTTVQAINAIRGAAADVTIEAVDESK